MGEVNADDFFCPNEACPDYGKKGKGKYQGKGILWQANTFWLLNNGALPR
ncbi:MAG: hypothetical protein WAV32_05025 [Halobacteriota archaeon]